jgi:flagellar biogenesis protein FliO
VNELLLTARTVLSLGAVLALLAGLVWALRRGTLKLSAFAPRGVIAIETATAVGDRRQLAIVSVEGRRVLVGMTPTAISFITELGSKPSATAPVDDGAHR